MSDWFEEQLARGTQEGWIEDITGQSESLLPIYDLDDDANARAEAAYQDELAEHSYEVHTLVSEMDRELEDPENALPDGAMQRWMRKGYELKIDIFEELSRHRQMKADQIDSDLPF